MDQFGLDEARGKVPKRWPGFRIFSNRALRLKWKIQVLEDDAQELSGDPSQQVFNEVEGSSFSPHSVPSPRDKITRYGLEMERTLSRLAPECVAHNAWLLLIRELLLGKLLETRKNAVTLAIQKLSEIADVVTRRHAYENLIVELRNVEEHAHRYHVLLFDSKTIDQLRLPITIQFPPKYWQDFMNLYTTEAIWDLMDDAEKKLNSMWIFN